jgi:diguanylate cyclase (GGDEF)-like protein
MAALAYGVAGPAWQQLQPLLCPAGLTTEGALRQVEQTARQLELVRRSEARFTGTFSHAAIGMALVGPDGEILLANRALHRLLDAPSGDLFGGTVYRWFDASDVPPLQRQDNTPRVQAEQQLRHIAFHDSLTRLPNRGQFEAQPEAAFERYCADAAQPCAVMFLDFDRFKLINDSLGHGVGDAFLREVAVRLRDVVLAAHLVARLGGDEFAVLLSTAPAMADLEILVEQEQRRSRAPIHIGGHELNTSAGIGIRVSEPTTLTAQEWLSDEDTAMYRAKAARKACHLVFMVQMHAEAVEHLEMARELRLAVTRLEISLAL